MSNEQLPAPQGESQAMVPVVAPRDEAVHALISAGMSRAGLLALTKEESAALMAEFPDSDFQSGAGGKDNLIYIEHAALRNRLNSVLGLGQWTLVVRETRTEKYEVWGKVEKRKVPAVRVFVRVTMIIRGSQVGDSIGDMSFFPHNAAQNYGDAWEGAKTAAFRRCAKEFGIWLQAWQRDWCAGWWARKAGKPQGRAAVVQPTTQRPKYSEGSEGDFVHPSDLKGGFDQPELDPSDVYDRGDGGPDLGPEQQADIPRDDPEPAAYSPQTMAEPPEILEIVSLKAQVGRVWPKLVAKDSREFSICPKDEALVKKFKSLWNPPAKIRVFEIEFTETQTPKKSGGGFFVNRQVVDLKAALK